MRFDEPLAGYLIPITSAQNLRTSLQIQTQTIGQISRSSAESFRCAPEILNSDVRQDEVISHGTAFSHLHDLLNSLKRLKYAAFFLRRFICLIKS